MIEINDKDALIMKLLHYFITERNYNPVIVQGSDSEIWLENMKENYKIVRIVSSYIHNDEQLNFDLFKAKRVAKTIQKKTFSFDMNILNIYTNLGENAHLNPTKDLMVIDLTEEQSLENLDTLKEDFPEMKSKLKFTEKGMELFLKITEDINKTNQKNAENVNRVFEKKTPYITYILIALNILVFLAGNFFGNYDTILDLFCMYAPFIRNGEYYRLITPIFLHADFFHLFFNCYALYVIGSQMESYLGKGKYAFIYLASGIFGNLLSMSLSNGYASVGASGAIFGLLGSMLYFGYHYRLYLGTVLKSQIIPLILFNLLYGFLATGIDNAAHIGGLIGGVLVTKALGVEHKSTKSDKMHGVILTILFSVFLLYISFVIVR